MYYCSTKLIINIYLYIIKKQKEHFYDYEYYKKDILIFNKKNKLKHDLFNW